MTQEILTAREERVVTRIREGKDELVALVTELVACDTTARDPGILPGKRSGCSRSWARVCAPWAPRSNAAPTDRGGCSGAASAG